MAICGASRMMERLDPPFYTTGLLRIQFTLPDRWTRWTAIAVPLLIEAQCRINADKAGDAACPTALFQTKRIQQGSFHEQLVTYKHGSAGHGTDDDDDDDHHHHQYSHSWCHYVRNTTLLSRGLKHSVVLVLSFTSVPNGLSSVLTLLFLPFGLRCALVCDSPEPRAARSFVQWT